MVMNFWASIFRCMTNSGEHNAYCWMHRCSLVVNSGWPPVSESECPTWDWQVVGSSPSPNWYPQSSCLALRIQGWPCTAACYRSFSRRLKAFNCFHLEYLNSSCQLQLSKVPFQPAWSLHKQWQRCERSDHQVDRRWWPAGVTLCSRWVDQKQDRVANIRHDVFSAQMFVSKRRWDTTFHTGQCGHKREAVQTL